MNAWRVVLTSVTSPVSAARAAGSKPEPARELLVLLGLTVLVGAATLPLQIPLLLQSLAPVGNLLRDTHHEHLRGGLVRLVVLDRVVPPPTVVLAAAMLAVTTESVLALPQVDRPRVRAIIALGLVPLVFQRAGELLLTWSVGAPSPLAPGFAVSLPQQFATGPSLFWAAGEAPAWIEAIGARLNLVTIWCVAIWAAGLRELDRVPLAAGHVFLPFVCLAAAGLVTWWLGPLVLPVILGHPA